MAAILAALLYPSSTMLIAQERQTQEGSVVTVQQTAIQRVLPGVVTIETKFQRSDDLATSRKKMIAETGIGFAIRCGTKVGIVTNYHVVADIPLDSILLTFHDLRFLRPVKVIGCEEFDIAVLVADKEPSVVPVADSNKVQVADPVLAIGNPFGLKESVSAGIISAKDRFSIPSGNHRLPLQGFFQTDTPVNPGNSGGPLMTRDGEVIGMVTAIASTGGLNEGVAFAIPINNVIRIATQMLEKGVVQRPYLGIELDPKFDADARTIAGLDRAVGARIQSVKPDATGAEAGMLPGDIVLRYDDIEVESDLHFIQLVARDTIGNSPSIIFQRDGQRYLCRPVLAAWDSPVKIVTRNIPVESR